MVELGISAPVFHYADLPPVPRNRFVISSGYFICECFFGDLIWTMLFVMSPLPWLTSQFVYMPYDARGSLLLGSACFVSTRGAGSIQELRHFFAGSRYLTELILQCEGLELYSSSHLAFSPVKTAHF